MTTAREKLYEDVVALTVAPPGPTAEAEIRKIMTRYRVQTKPGVDIPPGATARDALGDRIIALWRAGGDIKTPLGTAIDEFRMQLKSAGPQSPPPSKPLSRDLGRPRPPVPALEDDDDGPPLSARPGGLGGTDPNMRAPLSRPQSTPSAAPLVGGDPGATTNPGLARPKAARPSAEPVAGGPRKRGRTRGECPKCHSMGVVLARSYSGDEYFSCIYCGWQAFKPTEEDDPNASLAVRLLGQSATETPRE